MLFELNLGQKIDFEVIFGQKRTKKSNKIKSLTIKKVRF
jgi:hypothetical protein